MDAGRPSRSATLLGVACGVLAAAGFSLKAVLAKLAYRHDVDATTLLALRMAFAAPLYAVILVGATRGVPRLAGKDVARTAAIGIVGYFFASYFDFLGLRHISAGLERLVLYLYPTLVMLMGFVIYRRQVGAREVVASLCAYAGIALALGRDVALGRDAAEIALGTALVFGSALTYAAYVVGSGQLVHRVGSSRFTALAMLAATVPMMLVFVASGGHARLGTIPHPVLWLALAMALFATVLPSLLMTEGIRRLGASRAAVVGSVGPVATLGLEAALLDEPMTLHALAGTVLVVAGVLGATLVPARARTAAAPAAPSEEART